MIKNVTIGKVTLERSAPIPQLLLPLIAAAEAGAPLESSLTKIVTNLGFDTFMFGMTANPEVNHESQCYVYTTLPIDWVIRYDQMDYVEIDPRVLKTRDNPIPFVWDSESERGKDKQTDAFLDDAAKHCIASGFACEFTDAHYLRGVMALTSAIPALAAPRIGQPHGHTPAKPPEPQHHDHVPGTSRGVRPAHHDR